MGEGTTAGTTGQEPGTGTAPATGTGTAQAPASGTAQGTAPTTPPPATGATPDHSAELAAAQARIRELEQANLTDAEKRDKRLAELEAERNTWEVERQTMILRNAVWQEASKAGALYPDLVVQAIPLSSVKFGKDGQPENVPAVVATARTNYPALFRVAAGSGDGGAGQGAAGAAPTMNDLIRRGAGRGTATTT